MKATRILLLWLALYSAQAIARTDNTLEVWMDKDVTLTADGTTVTKLTVYEKNPNVDYTSFNMTISVPKGVRINKVKSGRDYKNDIELSVRANDHTIACNMPEEGMIKIISFSQQLLPYYPDDEDGNVYYPMFTIGLVADPSAYNGDYTIELSDCWFNAIDDTNTPYPNILDHVEYSNFTITGGTDFPGVDYTVPAEGCGTMILPFDADIPSGMAVYSCTGVSDGYVLQLEEVPSIKENTPYIVKGTPGTYHFDGVYKSLCKYHSQYMTGVFARIEVPEGAYVMQNHKETTGIGFYRVDNSVLNDNGEPVIVNISPYHCYLNELPSMAKMYRLPFGETTGIESCDDADDVNAVVSVYNVEGQIVRANVSRAKALKGLKRGVYIVNNKKYVVE